MIGLGLACSHAPSLFRPVEEWPGVYKKLIGDVPQPPAAAEETLEVLQGYKDRTDAAFEAMRKKLESYKPDALIVLGDDQGAIFTEVHIPQFCIYLGRDISGNTKASFFGEDPSDGQVTLQCHQDLANYLLMELVDREMDMSYSQFLNPQSQDFMAEVGPHAMIYPMPKLMPKLDIPVIPIFVNAYYPPSPSGHRCYQLGQAIADVMKDRPEKIAILASGGLSHDPLGPRAGWIDTTLDRWFLERLSRSRGYRANQMFDVDSDTVRGGTGEIRQWLTAAGACESLGGKATVLDYVPAHHSVTGLGFAYWELS